MLWKENKDIEVTEGESLLNQMAKIPLFFYIFKIQREN